MTKPLRHKAKLLLRPLHTALKVDKTHRYIDQTSTTPDIIQLTLRHGIMNAPAQLAINSLNVNHLSRIRYAEYV